MTLGSNWGCFFSSFCLCFAALGQAIGAETEVETRLVYVVLEGEPAAEVAVRLRDRGLAKREIAEATRERIAEIATQQDQLVARLGQVQGTVEAQFSRLANAVKVRLPLDQAKRLRQLDGVVAVKPVAQFHSLTSTSVPFIGATNVWNLGKLSATGKGIRIGIIDSGIDYNHAMFGGSGKVADYDRNNPKLIEKGTFPTKKVAGGYDFAGDDYDGTRAPRPDKDPLDCAESSHGSHVAGIAAGVGVLTNGVAYAGGYGKGLNMGKFLIGPGVAPEATLYALKVFGCKGTTGLSVEAMEWAADPDADGDLDDRLDVGNLSLGSAYTYPEFESNAAGRLAKLGCAVVRAAGNSGNNFYALMSMDDREITVANSMDDGIENNSIEVTAPPALRGHYEAVEAGFTRKLEEIGKITGKLVYADPPQACEVLKNPDDIKGHIALIDRGVCFFLDKVKRAKEAGARAVVVANNEGGPPIAMGTSGGTVDIPAVMITRRDGLRLKQQLEAGVFVNLGGDVTIGGPELADQLSPSSSRGPVYELQRLKPDLAAPGFNIHSAQAGGGAQPLLSGGTSMAAPHVAGVVALLMEQHPDWSPDTIKAAMMNTAIQTRDENGHPYPETRTGAGRVNPSLAIGTPVVAFDTESPERVSLSFGLLEISEPFLAKRRVTIQNLRSEPWSGSIAITNTLANAGVTLAPIEKTVTVPALGQAEIELELKIDPAKVELRSDPTTPPEVKGGPRHIAQEASGQVWIHGKTASTHVPYHMLLRLVGDHRIEESKVAVRKPEGVAPVTIPVEGGNAHPAPLASVFQLGYKSPSRRYKERERAARDLRAIGAASNVAELGNVADATLFFGVAMDGPWIVPQSFLTDIQIDLDTNLDGETDVELSNGSSGDVLVTRDITERELADDAYYTLVKDVESDEFKIAEILNLFPSSERDTALMNNSVMVFAVKAKELGLVEGRSMIRYRFNNIYETTRWLPFDVGGPSLRTANTELNHSPYHPADAPIQVSVDHDAFEVHGIKEGSMPKPLLLFHHNTLETQFDIVSLYQAAPDSDGDGLWDDWELTYFESLSEAGRSTDHDGDGFTDASEFAAGTDPTDGASLLRISMPIDVKNKTVLLRWDSVPGRRYRVERSNGDPGNWTVSVRGLLADSTTLTHTDLRIDNGSPVFYRLVLEMD